MAAVAYSPLCLGQLSPGRMRIEVVAYWKKLSLSTEQCTISLSVRSSLLDPLTGAAESSSKMISSYIIPPEMSGLTLSGQSQRGTPAATDCIYCRNEADAVTSYGTVSSQRKCRRPFVVASLDADHKYSCGVAPDTGQWPVMTSDLVDSTSSRTPSISVDDDLFLSLPCRTSSQWLKWATAQPPASVWTCPAGSLSQICSLVFLMSCPTMCVGWLSKTQLSHSYDFTDSQLYALDNRMIGLFAYFQPRIKSKRPCSSHALLPLLPLSASAICMPRRTSTTSTYV